MYPGTRALALLAAGWHNSAMPLEREPATKARSIAWGLGAGLISSLCCLGPAAAALLGLGASSSLAGLQLGRAPAIALGLTALAFGVVLALRRGAACALPPARRLRSPLITLACFGMSYTLLAVAIPSVAARQIAAAPLPPAAAPAAEAAGETRRLILSIPKMDCPPCAAIVQRRLAEQPGVTAFLATSDSDEVRIDYRPAIVSADALAGLFPPSYQVSVLNDVPLANP